MGEGLRGLCGVRRGVITLLLSLQVLLRVKESEIQYLKQEISSLKDELQTALRVMPAAGSVLRTFPRAVLISCVSVLRFQLAYPQI